MPGSSNKHEAPNFIVIDDNDKENVTEDEGSRGYSKIKGSKDVQHISARSNRAPFKKTSGDSSDEEDCVVVEPNFVREPSSADKGFSNGRRPRHPACQRLKLKRKSGRSNESSDSDIIVDLNGAVRRDWEEAALRRRMGNIYNTSRFRAFREGREERASVSNPTKRDGRQFSTGRQRTDTDCFEDSGDNDQATASVVAPAGVSAPDDKEEEDLGLAVDRQSSNPGTLDAQTGGQPISSRGPNSNLKKGLHAASNQQDSDPDVSGASLDDTSEEIFLTVSVSISEGHDVIFSDDECNTLVTEADDNMLKDSVQKTGDVETSKRLKDPHVESIQDPVIPVNGDTLVSGRERLKETEEFRLAVAEEWARRQLELQKQAQEAARERKRRKVEAERKLGMEVRQRQRLEEIRQSQLKEEQTSNLKEQLRGQIHSKLEQLGATCRDMATLLRHLGISVDGGVFPTTQQVNAAYKKALLRFHPDRMAALVKRDLSHQVEAEETFKLISRMKSILPSVATRLF